eukprot:gnl/TRDRNA2_/TRDRNA2_177478_c2_seq2.p1 gnl/TRDRNA2_/TRDRNA2_177478_c2~~gnl/TRDRNA2_/TRDRNA2_177478_c2_seq2.p1  ORF type:complete len:346 (+),score=38.12 gnl/TRDRNA2_/TRDRNA2_177478_c2_seq2:200-1237(+)
MIVASLSPSQSFREPASPHSRCDYLPGPRLSTESSQSGSTSASSKRHRQSSLLDEDLELIFCEDRVAFLEEQLQLHTIVHGSSVQSWSSTREIYTELEGAQEDADRAGERLTEARRVRKEMQKEAHAGSLNKALSLSMKAEKNEGRGSRLGSTRSTLSQVFDESGDSLTITLPEDISSARSEDSTTSTATPMSTKSRFSSGGSMSSESPSVDQQSKGGSPLLAASSFRHGGTSSPERFPSPRLVDVESVEDDELPEASSMSSGRTSHHSAALFGYAQPRESIVSLQSHGSACSAGSGCSQGSSDSGCAPGSTVDRVWMQFRAAKEAAAQRGGKPPTWSAEKNMLV